MHLHCLDCTASVNNNNQILARCCDILLWCMSFSTIFSNEGVTSIDMTFCKLFSIAILELNQCIIFCRGLIISRILRLFPEKTDWPSCLAARDFVPLFISGCAEIYLCQIILFEVKNGNETFDKRQKMTRTVGKNDKVKLLLLFCVVFLFFYFQLIKNIKDVKLSLEYLKCLKNVWLLTSVSVFFPHFTFLLLWLLTSHRDKKTIAR